MKDTGPKSITGHNGTDGSTPSIRIARYGSVVAGSGENISYGQSESLDVLI